VYPSAYANAYASKICAGKIKDPSGVKRKDFRGRKPAAEGGPINKMVAVERRTVLGKPRKDKIDKKPVLKPQPRKKMMGGGLMEATARLKRQGLKGGSGPIRVDHPKDHPDVKKMEKSVKKDREKTKEKFPILSKIFGTGNPKKDKQKAKRIADSLQTLGAEIRTKTEGSFARGGRAGLKGGGICKRGMNRKAVGKNS
jgi:hypothetical protein